MRVWIRNQGRLVRIDYLALPAPPVVPTMAAQNLHQRTLNELFAQFSSTSPSCIVLPENNADQFEILPATINKLPKFHGSKCEQPYIHLNKSLTICHTFKNQNLNSEAVKPRLLPLSLEDHAAAWLNSLTPNSITTWDDLVKKFNVQNFPSE